MDAMSNIRALFEKAQKLDMPGLAITDHGTLSGVPEFLKTAKDFPTVKPIAGCEFWLSDPSREHTYHLILLAKNLTGYHNLVKLTSIAGCDGVYKDDARPHIGAAMLAEYHEGLICTSACIGGEIPQLILASDMEGAKEAALWYRSIFGEDFYLEVSLHKNLGAIKLSPLDDLSAYKEQNRELVRLQKASNDGVFTIAKELGIKVVATNDVHFVSREDGIAHDVMLAMQRGRRIGNPKRRRYSHLEYLKSEKEMRGLFPEHPEVIENTIEVLDKVERYSITRDLMLPHVSDTPADELRRLAFDGAKARLGDLSDEIRERIDYELSVIARHDKAQEYILTVKRIVDCAREVGISVGPGRSSAPASFVNYCLGITGIDPIPHTLLFERFLNPESTTLPSIALDIEWGKQQMLLERLKEVFGEASVGHISTFQRYSPTRVYKSVAKTLGLKENDKEVTFIADKLVNVIYNSATHSCGIVIAPYPLSENVPVRKDEWGNLVSLYDSGDLKDVGLVRFDILELKELNVIKQTVNLIKKRYGVDVDIDHIPLDDPETLALYAKGDTIGVFQFQASGMIEWVRKMKSPGFYDLVALNALYRPGPMALLPFFVDRQTRFVPTAYAESGAEEFLHETYGIPVYQEQLVCLVRKYSALSKLEAEMVYKTSNREGFHRLFLEGGRNKGYTSRVLNILWEAYFKCGSTAFLKSHSLCYTWLSFQTAWLKAHYPKEFFRNTINSCFDSEWELQRLIPDCEAHGFKLVYPDNTESGLFEVEE